jgi:hypothetical protein
MLPPDCESALAQFDALRRGELPAAELDSLQRHLDGCRRCYSHKKHEDAFLERLLETTRRARCPEELRESVMRMIAKASNGN